MKRWLKILIWIIGTPIALLIILLSVYVIVNWQGVVDPYHIGQKNAKYRILIASQGSEFKYALVDKITNRLNSEDYYLSVTDCTKLDVQDTLEWNSIVIIHASQAHGMPRKARAFLEKLEDHSNVIIVTSSGGGDELISGFGVDAISCASRMHYTDNLTKWVIEKIEKNNVNRINASGSK